MSIASAITRSTPRSSPARRPGLRCIIAVQGGLALALILIWLQLALRGEFWRGDFPAFYLGWRIVLDGQGDRLYDRTTQLEYQRLHVPERKQGQALLAFVHPPHAAVAMAPLASLPRDAAFLLWSALQAIFLCLALRLLLDSSPDWVADERVALAASAIAFPAVFISFQLGQVALAALLCLAGFYHALARRNDFGSAAWLVLGAVKPQLMLIPAVTLIAAGRWRALGWSALLCGLWAAATTAVLGSACWSSFLNIARHSAVQFGADGIFPERMYNLKGLLVFFLGAERAWLINALAAASICAALLFAAWIFRRRDALEQPRFLWNAAATLQLGLLCNPHFNPADAVCFIVPAILFLAYVRAVGWPETAWGLLFLACTWLFLLDAFIWTTAPFRPFFLVMVGLFGVMGMSRPSLALRADVGAC